MSSRNRLALGFSSSSWPLLKRLKDRQHVDHLALTPFAFKNIETDNQDELLIGNASELVEQFWKKGGKLILVGSVSASVRIISPFITDKDKDPAVLVMDAKAINIVPILGSHSAGADQFAIELAEDFRGSAILTSHSQTQEKLSLDSFGFSWGWNRSGTKEEWNKLMIGQSSGESIEVNQRSGLSLWKQTEQALKILSRNENNNLSSPFLFNISSHIEAGCCWHPNNLWIGIGCERNTSKSLIERAINNGLKQLNLSKESIAGISTIDLKFDEIGLIELIKDNSWHIRFYSSKELSNVSVPNPSEIVKREIGSTSVAEASALLAAGEGSELLLEKNIFSSLANENGAVTIAIAQSLKSFAPQKGELHLVGSGPGQISFLTSDACLALSKCVIWIGYKPYLDFLEPLRRKDQMRIDSEITKEKERCKKALDLAQQGVKVALISSGDIGIYGMAGLALELLLEQKEKERSSVEVHPGISAFQLAAAKIGAPIMSDFCCISLSDLLTPWEKIEKRLKSAAVGDFVVSIYNPRSLKRDWQLRYAIEIFLEERSASTPILCARQLGRSKEKVEIYRLDSLPYEQVDMFTILIIGNSKSFVRDDFFVTPRGYAIS